MIDKSVVSSWVSEDRVIVLGEGGGSDDPLFVIHSITGGTGFWQPFADRIDIKGPVYGVNALGYGRWDCFDETIEDMAASAFEVIGSVQPAGPYRICGYSLGGVIAYEVARMLRMQTRENTNYIAILDSNFDDSNCEGSENDVRDFWLTLWNITVGRAVLARIRKDDGFWKLNSEQKLKVLYEDSLTRKDSRMPPEWSLSDLRTYYQYFDALWTAARLYKPRKIDVPAVFFATTEAVRRQWVQNWKKMATNTGDIVEVPGTHISVFDPPTIDIIAKRITEDLARSPIGLCKT